MFTRCSRTPATSIMKPTGATPDVSIIKPLPTSNSYEARTDLKITMKMTSRILSIGFFTILYLLSSFTSAEAQIWKKVKKKAQETLERKAEQNTEALIEGIENAVKCVVTDRECIAQGQQEGKTVVMTDDEGKVIRDESGAPIVSEAPADSTAGSLSSRSTRQETPGTFQVMSSTVTKVEMASQGQFRSDSLFLKGFDLWNAKSNRIEAKGWAFYLTHRGQKEAFKGPVRKVIGAPDYLYFMNTGSSGFDRRSYQVSLNAYGFTSRAGSVYKNKTPSQVSYWSEHSMQKKKKIEGHLSTDLRRVVFIRDGDIWRAEYDWSKNEIVREAQVTSLGLFEGKKPLFWHGNALYLEGGFSEAKPIVRIDLMSGTVEELPRMVVFESSRRGGGIGFTNPAGSVLCRPGPELLYCYDAKERSAYQISIEYDYEGASAFQRGGRGGLIRQEGIDRNGRSDHIFWLNAHVFAAVHTGRDVVSRIDLQNRRVDVLLQVDAPQGLGMRQVLPSGRWIELTTAQTRAFGSPANQRRFLLDLTDGSVSPLELPFDVEGEWLDDRTYLYAKKDGGLSQVGTWVYDRTSNQSRKLCGAVAAQGHSSNKALLFSELGVIYFASRTGSPAVYRADLTNGECTKAFDGMTIPHHVGLPPIDLGIGSRSSAWTSTPSVTPAPTGSTARPSSEGEQLSSPQTAEVNTSTGDAATGGPATGMERILRATENLPYEHQEEVKKAYETSSSNYTLSNFYDPACVALSFWEERRNRVEIEEFQITWQSFTREGSNYETCVDQSRISAHSRDRAQKILQGRRHSEERISKIQTCVSDQMVKEFVADPPENISRVDYRFKEIFVQCNQQ